MGEGGAGYLFIYSHKMKFQIWYSEWHKNSNIYFKFYNVLIYIQAWNWDPKHFTDLTESLWPNVQPNIKLNLFLRQKTCNTGLEFYRLVLNAGPVCVHCVIHSDTLIMQDQSVCPTLCHTLWYTYNAGSVYVPYTVSYTYNAGLICVPYTVPYTLIHL